jgi:hypothetical protein
MATTFIGFSRNQLHTLRADFLEAQRLCMHAVNNLLLNPAMQMNERPRELLWLTFHLSGRGDSFWDSVDPIKNTFLGFRPRSEVMTVRHDTSRPTGASNTIEFVAFTRPSDANSMFIRNQYFSGRSRRERALTLIHEYVHLRNPQNPGDGHPGGVVIMFGEGDVGIEYRNAIRNPYCFQYFVDWLA